MNFRLAGIAVLTAGLSLLPVLYLRLIWATIPALVATHSSQGVANHFAERQALWTVAWWPALAFVTLTFWPQVHDGQSLFWSSPRQRQFRALVVGTLVICLTAAMHNSIALGKASPAAPTRGSLQQAH
jgi:hypothetical protein